MFKYTVYSDNGHTLSEPRRIAGFNTFSEAYEWLTDHYGKWGGTVELYDEDEEEAVARYHSA